MLSQAESHHSLLSDISNDPFFQAVHGARSEADGDPPFQSLYRRVTHKRPSQVLTSSQTQTVPDRHLPYSQPLQDRMSEVAGDERSVSQQESLLEFTHTAEEVSRRDCRDIMVQTDDEESIANDSMVCEPAQRSGFVDNQAIQTGAVSPQLVAASRNRRPGKTSIGLQTAFTDKDGQFEEEQKMQLTMETFAVSPSGVLLQSMEPEEDLPAFPDNSEVTSFVLCGFCINTIIHIYHV